MRAQRWMQSGVMAMASLTWGSLPLAYAQSNQPPSMAGSGPVDEQRARSIQAQFKDDPVLKDEPVVIEVTGKHVRLSGSVGNPQERLRAEQLVHDTDPTLVIENQLEPREREPAPTPAPGQVKVDVRGVAHKTNKAVDEV